ncbi:hypothetical protein OHC33_004766 [Knufia fluminis]|uniref:USP domain-containing protein n=1 Tax=Knufia fluminis TaxID=191047 RepID=A0AAN8EZ73_9EURO|nr:hypothetical protein OHC33_004766 [Knufia fluminis]
MPPKRAFNGDGEDKQQPKKAKTQHGPAAQTTASRRSQREKTKNVSAPSKATKTANVQKQQTRTKLPRDAKEKGKQSNKQSKQGSTRRNPAQLTVNTEKANTQQPTDPSSASAVRPADAAGRDVAPNSVGPPFTPVINVSDLLKQGVRARTNIGEMPTGISNGPGIHCYRNAVLTMLLSCEPFMACIDQGTGPIQPEAGSLDVLDWVHYVAEKAKQGNQAELDEAVKGFWDATCFPSEDQRATVDDKLPHKTWATFRSSKRDDNVRADETEEDANEFLTWLLSTMRAQLGPFTQDKDTPQGTKRSTDQANFDWLNGFSRARRQVCSKCSWRVRRRVQTRREHQWILAIDPYYSVTRNKSSPHKMTLSNLIQADLMNDLEFGTRCPRCRREDADVMRYDDINQAPDVLFICIARYKAEQVEVKVEAGEGNGKKSKAKFEKVPEAVKDVAIVEIPEQLNLTEFLNDHDYGEGSKLEYHLSGVVSHSGVTADSGHYHSFVRAGEERNEWYRINDADVEPCENGMSDFDDKNTMPGKRRTKAFKSRFTPYVLLYERDPEKSEENPGRAAQNVNEGSEKDERPTFWTGGSPRAQTPGAYVRPPSVEPAQTVPTVTLQPASSAVPREQTRFPGLEDEAQFPEARLDLTLNLEYGGKDITIPIPPRFISHFDRQKTRKIWIEATITAAEDQSDPSRPADESKVKCKRLDLTDAFMKEEIEQRLKEKRTAGNATHPMQEWTEMWQDVGPPSEEDRGAGTTPDTEADAGTNAAVGSATDAEGATGTNTAAGAPTVTGADTSNNADAAAGGDASSDTIVANPNPGSPKSRRAIFNAFMSKIQKANAVSTQESSAVNAQAATASAHHDTATANTSDGAASAAPAPTVSAASNPSAQATPATQVNTAAQDNTAGTTTTEKAPTRASSRAKKPTKRYGK